MSVHSAKNTDLSVMRLLSPHYYSLSFVVCAVWAYWGGGGVVFAAITIIIKRTDCWCVRARNVYTDLDITELAVQAGIASGPLQSF